MNVFALLGFVASAAVFVAAIFTTSNNFMIFISVHATLIVMGGTLAACFISFPLPRVITLIGVFFRRVFGTNKVNYPLLIDEIVALSQAFRKGNAALEASVMNTQNPFLRDAANILFFLEADVPPEELRNLLEARAETHFERYMEEANFFHIMAKFPPAFGLMGTTIGMIVLLQSLGSPNSKNLIGPAMAVALVATLYGIVLANFFFIPIAENLKKQSKEDLVARRMVVEGVMMVGAGMPTKFVEEKVKSYLLPSERPASKLESGRVRPVGKTA